MIDNATRETIAEWHLVRMRRRRDPDASVAQRLCDRSIAALERSGYSSGPDAPDFAWHGWWCLGSQHATEVVRSETASDRMPECGECGEPCIAIWWNG